MIFININAGIMLIFMDLIYIDYNVLQKSKKTVDFVHFFAFWSFWKIEFVFFTFSNNILNLEMELTSSS